MRTPTFGFVAAMALCSTVLTSFAPAASSAEASMQELQIVSTAAAKYYGYLTPAIAVRKGDELVYTNLDLERHDVVQDVAEDGVGGPKREKWCARFDGKCPLFWTKQIGLGESTPVLGLDNVKPNTIYTFFCTLHNGMKGKLIVLP